MTTFNELAAKKEINLIFNSASFRRFGNAFRKHVNPNFKQEYNTKDVGGLVGNGFTWYECASYIIGDGNFSITESQYNSFMSEF